MCSWISLIINHFKIAILFKVNKKACNFHENINYIWNIFQILFRNQLAHSLQVSAIVLRRNIPWLVWISLNELEKSYFRIVEIKHETRIHNSKIFNKKKFRVYKFNIIVSFDFKIIGVIRPNFILCRIGIFIYAINLLFICISEPHQYSSKFLMFEL